MPSEKRKQEVAHSRSNRNSQIAPGPERGRIDGAKNIITRKTDSPVPQVSGPMTQTTARH